MTIGDETDAPGAPGAPLPVPGGPQEQEGPGIAKARREPEPAPPPATPDAPPTEPDKNAYRVKLPAFEGPLDLLLHLIQKHELDILDIPIGFVTEKYVEFIILMEELNIDIASEYLVMAATLAHIKSKMLLPTPPEDQDSPAEDEEDPRAELVRRLLEYQKYRLAGEELGSRAVLGRDVFSRGTAESRDEGPAPLAPTSLFKLMEAFESILKRVQQTQEHQIDFERISITERINQLSDILRQTPLVEFDQLFVGQRTRADVIVTFLALLEMTRLRLTRIAQESPYSPIYVELSVREDGAEGASRLEDFVPTSAAEEAPLPALGTWTGVNEPEGDFAADLDDEELPDFLAGGDVPLSDDELVESVEEPAPEVDAGSSDKGEETAPEILVDAGGVGEETAPEIDAGSDQALSDADTDITVEAGEPEPAPAGADEVAESLPEGPVDEAGEKTPPDSTRGDTES